MSEEQSPYGLATVEALASIFSTPEGWQMAKQAIFQASANIIDSDKFSIYTALAILDCNASGQIKLNN